MKEIQTDRLLSTRIYIFDPDTKELHSPVKKYVWKPKTIYWAECEHDPEKNITADCRCGFYSSPLPRVLEDYQGGFYILALCLLYGDVFLEFDNEGSYNGGRDMPYVITRSAGCKIVGLVSSGEWLPEFDGYIHGYTMRIIALAETYPELRDFIFPWKTAQKMIAAQWKRLGLPNPYSINDLYKFEEE